MENGRLRKQGERTEPGSHGRSLEKGRSNSRLLFIRFSMMNSLILAIVVAVPSSITLHAAEEVQLVTKDSAYKELSKTFGFIRGQDLMLKKVRQEFPDLSFAVIGAFLQFDSAFGKATIEIDKEMQTLLKEHYPKFLYDVQAQFEAANLNSKTMTYETALNFLAEVESRAKGKIPSPILETLLSFEYKDIPSEEFSSGYTRAYSTVGHSKSKGLDLTFRYPMSWKAAEAERPNIIQKFTRGNADGLESFSVVVKDIPLPDGYVFSQQELDDLFSDSELKNMLPSGGRFISGKPVIIDNHKGGVLLYDQTAQRLDVTKVLRIQGYATIVKDKMVLLQFMVVARGADEHALQARFEKYEPLFRMIANSFIILNQYSEPGYVLPGQVENVAESKTTADNPILIGGLVLSLIFILALGLLPPLLLIYQRRDK